MPNSKPCRTKPSEKCVILSNVSNVKLNLNSSKEMLKMHQKKIQLANKSKLNTLKTTQSIDLSVQQPLVRLNNVKVVE